MTLTTAPRLIFIVTVIACVVGCGGGEPSPSSSTPATASVPPSTTAPSGSTDPSPGEPTGSPTTSGALEPYSSLLTTRAGHSATLLADGRVLVAGGCVEDSCEGITSGTELVDVATRVSVAGPEMTEPRVGHVTVALPDGRLFIVGGFGPSRVTASTEVFDPETGAFAPGPAMSAPRADPTAVLLRDGTVLVAGGWDGSGPLATAEIYDPSRRAFRTTGALAVARAGQVSEVLADGRVLVAGGNAGTDGAADAAVQASAEIYDPATGAWTPTGDMTVRRHKHAGVLLRDGRVLIVGGSDERDGQGRYRSAEIYDPTTGVFTATGDMLLARYKIQDAVVPVGDGLVLVAGGASSGELFDPSTGQFRPVGGAANLGWSFGAAVPLRDGTVLVSGGYDDTIALTDAVSRYVP